MLSIDVPQHFWAKCFSNISAAKLLVSKYNINILFKISNLASKCFGISFLLQHLTQHLTHHAAKHTYGALYLRQFELHSLISEVLNSSMQLRACTCGCRSLSGGWSCSGEGAGFRGCGCCLGALGCSSGCIAALDAKLLGKGVSLLQENVEMQAC